MQKNKFNKNYGLLVLVILSLLLVGKVTLAEDINPGELKGEFRNKIGEIRDDQKNYANTEKVEFKNQAGEIRGEFKDKVANKEFENKGELVQARNEMIESIKNLRDEFKNSLLQNREEVRTRIQTEKEKFLEELGKLKDEKKKETSERIFSKIAELNIKMTDNLSKLVDNLEKVLLGIESRTNKAQDNGSDVSAVENKIVNAKETISLAREAILEQSKKTYTTTITDETKLKEEMKALRDAFAKDIKAVRETVKAIHDKIREAVTVLAQIPKVDEDNNSVEDQEDNNNE